MIEELWGNYVNSKLETQKDIKDYLKTITCIVFVKCYRFDKYGRLLADVYIDYNSINCKSISEILLSEGLAYEYDGGTKLTEEEQVVQKKIK